MPGFKFKKTRKFGSPSGGAQKRKDAKPSGGERGVSTDVGSFSDRGAALTPFSETPGRQLTPKAMRARLEHVKKQPRYFRDHEFTLKGISAVTGLSEAKLDEIMDDLAELMVAEVRKSVSGDFDALHNVGQVADAINDTKYELIGDADTALDLPRHIHEDEDLNGEFYVELINPILDRAGSHAERRVQLLAGLA